jgi:molybdopterin-guanine dinucleotide biosynthesis protein A
VWPEPELPVHPLAGIVAALERAAPRPVVALACDMPFVPAELIGRLAALAAVAAAPPGEAFPARYEPAALAVLRAGLEREAPLRAVLEELGATEVAAGGPPHALLGVNDPAALARAEALLP